MIVVEPTGLRTGERITLTLRLPVPEDDGATVIDLTVTPWREAAACLEVQDEVSFFPHKEDLVGIVRAKAVCATCPVADVCLSWAIETNQGEGIWGGHTPKERRKLRRRWIEETHKAS